MKGYPCALPEHLRDRLHNDWFWILKKIPRSFNAKGPRCGAGRPGYAPWPPRLVEGHGVARWESDFGNSILEVPDLAKRAVKAADVYGKSWTVIERNAGHPDCGQTGTITLTWRELDWSEIEAGHGLHSPSALQKFSMRGWLRLAPDYFSCWKIITRRELPGAPDNADDTVAFLRRGSRPDHVDVYYNTDRCSPIGMAGLKWE